jgi:hypothetical protein
LTEATHLEVVLSRRVEHECGTAQVEIAAYGLAVSVHQKDVTQWQEPVETRRGQFGSTVAGIEVVREREEIVADRGDVAPDFDAIGFPIALNLVGAR